MNEKRIKYKSDEITVSFAPDLCIHSAECVRGLPSVFNTNKKPWVNIAGGTPDEIVSLVPGGVLVLRSLHPFRDSALVAGKTKAVSTVFGREVHVMGEVEEEELLKLTGIEPVREKASVEDAFVYLSTVNNG